ncbi:MAG: glycosyltransferase family 4 protein [Jatrophihabitans sp.]|uniref:glycosyltransferase family 4 protein n=1 Tax=Jatrophihabitans sp. TaxID=1932789 RepID=UPI003F7FC4EA
MISFVWSPGNPLPAGTGGSENYTTGQVRELNRRGVAAQVVTIGLGVDDGRTEYDDVPFQAVASLDDVSALDGTIVFVNDIAAVATRRPSFQILHHPPPIRERYRRLAVDSVRDRVLIATSRYAAGLWSDYLEVDRAAVHVVYPFAEPPFADQPRRAPQRGVTRVLYAGRLSPEKGIYTLLSMLHVDVIAEDPALSITITTSGADKPQGRIIAELVAAHPGCVVVPARRTPADMAELMAAHDIVVVPSNAQYWHETFGIVSIEAQHPGCWVVASDDGGLPETDSGGVLLVQPDNAEALAWGVRETADRGPMSTEQRAVAGARFTVGQSVVALLDVLAAHGHGQVSTMSPKREATLRPTALSHFAGRSAAVPALLDITSVRVAHADAGADERGLRLLPES